MDKVSRLLNSLSVYRRNSVLQINEIGMDGYLVLMIENFDSLDIKSVVSEFMDFDIEYTFTVVNHIQDFKLIKPVLSINIYFKNKENGN